MTFLILTQTNHGQIHFGTAPSQKNFLPLRSHSLYPHLWIIPYQIALLLTSRSLDFFFKFQRLLLFFLNHESYLSFTSTIFRESVEISVRLKTCQL